MEMKILRLEERTLNLESAASRATPSPKRDESQVRDYDPSIDVEKLRAPYSPIYTVAANVQIDQILDKKEEDLISDRESSYSDELNDDGNELESHNHSDGPETKSSLASFDDDSDDGMETSLVSSNQAQQYFKPRTIEEELRPTDPSNEIPATDLSPSASSSVWTSPWMLRPRTVLPSIGSSSPATALPDIASVTSEPVGKVSSNQSSPGNSNGSSIFPSPRLRSRFPQSLHLREDLGGNSSAQYPVSPDSSTSRSSNHYEQTPAPEDHDSTSSVDAHHPHEPTVTPTKQSLSSPNRYRSILYIN